MHLRKLMTGAVAAAAMGSAQAVTLLTEGFDNISTLAGAGWVLTNNSDTPTQPWARGNGGVFPSFSGAADSFIAASFVSSGLDTGKVSNWLITPTINLAGANTLTFYARTESALYSDSLVVRLSTSTSDTASFTTTLLALPVLPTTWTLYSVALPTVASARIAFEYAVPNASNADYVGIDSVLVATTPVPEPASMALLGLGLAGLLIRRRLTA